MSDSALANRIRCVSLYSRELGVGNWCYFGWIWGCDDLMRILNHVAAYEPSVGGIEDVAHFDLGRCSVTGSFDVLKPQILLSTCEERDSEKSSLLSHRSLQSGFPPKAL
jgi:hypothetical protein